MKKAGLNLVYAAAVAAILSCSPAPNSSTTGSGTAGETGNETTGSATAGTTGGDTAGTTGGDTAGTTGGDTAGTTGGDTAGTTSGATTGGATGGSTGTSGGDGLPTTGGGTTGGGATGGTGGDPSGLSCSGIIQCINSCEDESCATQCISSGSPAAQQLITALAQCLQTACPNNDEACVEDAASTGACAAQANECIGTGGGGSASSCSAAFTCMGMCQDETCATACLQLMDPDSGMIWNALAMCLQTACPDQTDLACQQMALSTTCGTQLQACMGDTMKPGVGANFEAMNYVFWRPFARLMSHLLNFNLAL